MTAVLCSDTGSVQYIYIVSPLWWRQQTLSVLKPPICSATCNAKHLPTPPPPPNPQPLPIPSPPLPLLTFYLPLPFSTSLQFCPLSFLSSHLLYVPLYFPSYLNLCLSLFRLLYHLLYLPSLLRYLLYLPYLYSKSILLVCCSVIFIDVAQRRVLL
jgi:hypothetical protein